MTPAQFATLPPGTPIRHTAGTRATVASAGERQVRVLMDAVGKRGLVDAVVPVEYAECWEVCE